MTAFTQHLPVVAAVAIVGLVLAALLAAVALPVLQPRLERLAPRSRFSLLQLVAAAPVLSALAFLSISFVPSLLEVMGLVRDHCAAHVGHAFHLCFVHGVPPQATWPLALAAVAALALVRSALMELIGWRRAARWAAQLQAVAQYDEVSDCWMLEGEGVALTVGALRPQIFVSKEIATRLQPAEWRAILEHERAHRRRHDSLAKSFARLLSTLHLPHVRRRVLAALDVASEQACDDAASTAVGSRIDVAAAIVAMARMSPARPQSQFVQAFGAHAIEQRVSALLDENRVAVPRFAGWLTIGALAIAIVPRYESLHHVFETVLIYFF